MLTKEQVAHFRTFGFVVQSQLFPPNEMKGIQRDFDEVMAKEASTGGRSSKGEPFTGEESQKLLWVVELSPYLARLVEDDRIYTPIEQIIGQDPLWVMSDGHLFVGDTNGTVQAMANHQFWTT